jgi:hypothetical protein
MDHLPESGRVLAERVAARIERLRGAVQELERRFPSDAVQMASAGGEVVVSVDRGGRLVGLQLAPGSTSSFTCANLEHLINETLCAAAVCVDRRQPRTALPHQRVWVDDSEGILGESGITGPDARTVDVARP